MSEQEKKQNTVAEVLVKCLENEGVKYVFGFRGGKSGYDECTGKIGHPGDRGAA